MDIAMNNGHRHEQLSLQCTITVVKFQHFSIKLNVLLTVHHNIQVQWDQHDALFVFSLL
jgi:hypothetical protein